MLPTLQLQNKLRSLSIRSKQFVLLAVALLPLLGLVCMHIYKEHSDRMNHELATSVAMAEMSGVAFSQYIESVWTTNEALGRAIFLNDAPLSFDRAEQLMTEQLRSHESVTKFIWANPEGVIQASTHEGLRERQLLYWDQFRHVTKRAVILLSNDVDGTTTLGIASAIRRADDLLGIIVAIVPTISLESIIPIELTEERYVGIIDPNGFLVFSTNLDLTNLPYEDRKLSLSGPIGEALRGRKVTSREFYPTADSSMQMGAIVPIKALGWAAGAAAPVETILAGLRARMVRDILMMVVISLLSVMGVLVITNNLIAQIAGLRDAAHSWAQAKFEVRAPVIARDELAATTETFNEMADKLQRLETERNRFVDMAVHELNNPLASAKSTLQMMRYLADRDASVPKLTERIRNAEEAVARTSRVLSEMVEGLSTGRLQSPILPERRNLTEIVVDVVDSFRAGMDSHVLTLQTNQRPIWANLDQERIEEVLRNLILNAVKYSPEGKEISVTLDATEEHALLKVRDHGIGIPVSEQPRIFDQFYRASNVTNELGSGIGLYICRETVQRHGGTLSVESEPGKGSTFTVQLPLR